MQDAEIRHTSLIICSHSRLATGELGYVSLSIWVENLLLWVGLCQQPSTHTTIHSLCSPLLRMGERTERTKVRKTVGWNKDSLVSEGKNRKVEGKKEKSDTKAFVHHLPLSGPCPSSLQATVTLEVKLPSPALFFLHCSCTAEYTMLDGIVPWLAHLRCFSSFFFPVSCLPTTHSGGRVEIEKTLIQCKYGSDKTTVCYQHCFSYKSKTQHHSYYKIHFITSRYSTTANIFAFSGAKQNQKCWRTAWFIHMVPPAEG